MDPTFRKSAKGGAPGPTFSFHPADEAKWDKIVDTPKGEAPGIRVFIGAFIGVA